MAVLSVAVVVVVVATAAKKLTSLPTGLQLPAQQPVRPVAQPVALAILPLTRSLLVQAFRAT